MTDRLKGLVVTFEADIREDEAKDIINAIAMIRGVWYVESLVADPGDWVVAERARRELRHRVQRELDHPINEV